MLLKLILFTATLYVVSASVITLNAYDDHEKGLEDTEENPTLRKCNNQECDQRCRRLKFRGGACVNGRCKCDNFRTSEDFASVIEEYVGQRKCDPRECHQRCRRLQFPGGACVNGRCKCDNFRTAEVEGSSTAGETIDNEVEKSDLSLGELENAAMERAEYTLDSRDSQKERRCIPRICSRICRLLRFDNGTCVNERCKCGRKVKESTDSDEAHDNQEKGYQQMLGNNIEDHEKGLDDSEENPTLRKCNNQECDQRCRRLKFRGGACVNGRCKCDNFRTSDDFASVTEEYVGQRKCDPRECHQRCRRLQFPGGACVNGRCKCDNFRTAEVEGFSTAGETIDNEIEESDLSLAELEDAVVESAEYTLDSRDAQKKRRCIPRICSRICRLLRFDNGTCVNERCKCGRKVKESTDSDEAHDNQEKGYQQMLGNNIEDPEKGLEDTEENPTLRKCNNQECDQRCRRLKFRGGACVNGRCKCDNFRTSDDFASVTEEYVGQRKCDPRECHQRCRRLQFPGGACVNGRCKCDNFRTAEVEGFSTAGETIDNEIEESDLSLAELEDAVVESAKYTLDSRDAQKKRRCIPRICSRICRLLRFDNGTCVNERCKCGRKVKESTDSDEAHDNQEKGYQQMLGNNIEDKESNADESNVDDANNEAEVYKQNLNDGENLEVAEFAPVLADSTKELRCVPRICNLLCYFLRRENGTCVNGRCKCRRQVTELQTTDVTSSNEAEESKRNLDEELAEPVIENAEISADPTELVKKIRCAPNICNRVCRLKRRGNGTCVDGRCQCYKKATPEPYNDGPEESHQSDNED